MTDKEMVGVLVSGGFGAGWSTWGEPEMALDQELVRLFEEGACENEIKRVAGEKYSEVYQGGLLDCAVHWVEKGTRFRINEYDGNETLEIESDDSWQVAL